MLFGGTREMVFLGSQGCFLGVPLVFAGAGGRGWFVRGPRRWLLGCCLEVPKECFGGSEGNGFLGDPTAHFWRVPGDGSCRGPSGCFWGRHKGFLLGGILGDVFGTERMVLGGCWGTPPKTFESPPEAQQKQSNP